MICRMIRLVVLTALFLSVGGHWALIQSAAWAGMFLNFAKQGTLRSAVVKTFDGKHPCRLCQWVDQEQNKSSKPGSKGPETKLEVQLYAEKLGIFWVPQNSKLDPPISWGFKACARSDEPRHSPPRGA